MEEAERCLLLFYNHVLLLRTCPSGLASDVESARRKRRRRRVHVVVLSVNGFQERRSMLEVIIKIT